MEGGKSGKRSGKRIRTVKSPRDRTQACQSYKSIFIGVGCITATNILDEAWPRVDVCTRCTLALSNW